MSLQGKICLVTGATRGIGRGIALQLGAAGATVYITGRTLNNKVNAVGSSLEEVAQEIDDRGGQCVPIQCDHSDDNQVKQLFENIKEKENGRLDILVNNAYAGVDPIFNSFKTKFYDLEPTMWDDINNVGLRNHYFCTVYAARMMVERKNGLIITISSVGGLRYLFNVPYGIGKAACDRMMADCAVELKRENVACISLWPGPVLTEKIEEMLKNSTDEKMKLTFLNGETPEFSGKCISQLASDPNIMRKSGRILMTSDLGDEYGIKDINGKTIGGMRSVSSLLEYAGWKTTASFIPGFIRIPYWMLHLAGNKF